MKKLRIAYVRSAFEGVTLSKDFIDKTDELLDLFETISKNQLFGSEIRSGLVEGEYVEYPVWFTATGLNNIADWVVSHFEIRIQYLLVN